MKRQWVCSRETLCSSWSSTVINIALELCRKPLWKRFQTRLPSTCATGMYVPWLLSTAPPRLRFLKWISMITIGFTKHDLSTSVFIDMCESEWILLVILLVVPWHVTMAINIGLAESLLSGSHSDVRISCRITMGELNAVAECFKIEPIFGTELYVPRCDTSHVFSWVCNQIPERRTTEPSTTQVETVQRYNPCC